MADNNYKSSNSLGDNYLSTNPYAEGGVVQLKVKQTSNCHYLASLSYVVAAGGATTTVTPITGNLSADLQYYRVEVYDGSAIASGELDYASPAAAFVVDTSALDANKAWTLSFYGEEGGNVGDAGCSLEYKHSLGIIGVAGGSGDTIPPASKWKNVSFRLMLESTGDANFTLFPTEGVEIADGGSISLVDYLSTGTQLANAGSYLFKLQIKKIGNSPVAATPTPAANDAYASFASTVTFPYSITKDFVEALNALTIKTSVAGAFSDVLTVPVTGEGVKTSVSFTIVTDVAV